MTRNAQTEAVAFEGHGGQASFSPFVYLEERINLQQDGSKAKAYQVRQVRGIILKYKLEIEGA